jgi:hypothetical protein
MRDPEMRRRLLSEVDAAIAPMRQFLDPERAFPFGTTPDYEPAREHSVAGIARAQGRNAMEVFYDVLMEDDGRKLVLRPLLNYSGFSLDPVRAMLSHPTTAWGLGDGGAHCGTTCDASTPTFMPTHWVRARAHDQLPLAFVVNKMTAQTAALYGLGDRARLGLAVTIDWPCSASSCTHLPATGSCRAAGLSDQRHRHPADGEDQVPGQMPRDSLEPTDAGASTRIRQRATFANRGPLRWPRLDLDGEAGGEACHLEQQLLILVPAALWPPAASDQQSEPGTCGTSSVARDQEDAERAR